MSILLALTSDLNAALAKLRAAGAYWPESEEALAALDALEAIPEGAVLVAITRDVTARPMVPLDAANRAAITDLKGYAVLAIPVADMRETFMCDDCHTKKLP